MLWKWANIRQGLEAAGRLITTNYKGSRRAISLVHPNLSESSTHTLNLAVQLVKAGESVYSHRPKCYPRAKSHLTASAWSIGTR